jgi:3-phosphoshikimate 1-carboxyvinyltransferase
MERVAEPLRRMGARISTSDGHAPVVIDGGDLVGIEWRAQTPSAQVKSAVLLAGLSAQGDTTVVESAPTRDHTERILRALAAPLDASRDRVSIRSFQHEGFAATVPGDPSSAAFLLVAAGLTGSPVTIEGVCLNETRTRFVEVLRRMGMSVDVQESEQVMGEPVGSLVSSGRIQEGVSVARDEAPLLIDEIPALALAGAHAGHPSSFEGLGELRVKESDRLAGMCDGIRGLGGEATVEDDTLLVAGTGLSGGVADSRGDHRMAMAFAVGALAAGSRCRILGMEATAVSFPSFLRTLRDLGSEVT